MTQPLSIAADARRTGASPARRLALLALAALVWAAVPGTARATRSQAPDALGYTWADSYEPNVAATNPAYNPTTNLRAGGFSGDDVLTVINLPAAVFPAGFPYYGQSYSRLWLSSNGWIAFNDPLGNPGVVSIDQPSTGAPNALMAFFWNDLTLETIGGVPAANAGANVAGDGYTIHVRHAPKTTPASTLVLDSYVTLFRDGRIKFVYQGNFDRAGHIRNQIGIENQTGAVGQSYMSFGATRNGAVFGTNYSVEFYPPPQLDCLTGVTPVTCGMAATPFSNATGVSRVSSYGCAAGSFLGNEKVFRLDLTAMAAVNVNLVNSDGRSRGVFLIEPGCNEFVGCRGGGGTSVSNLLLGPGSYSIVVDGVTALDNGSFTLAVSCSGVGQPVGCGQTLTAEATSGTGQLTNWSCAGPHTGPEKVYAVNLPQTTTLRAALANKSNPDLRLIVTDPNGFQPASPACQISDPNAIASWSAGPGTYYLTVDGANGAQGSYDLSVDCARRLDCSAPGAVLDVEGGVPVAGDTSRPGARNSTDEYFCASSTTGAGGHLTGYTGNEDVYAFTITQPANVSLRLDAVDPNMRVLILRDDCYEGSCVIEGGCSEPLEPGSYFAVVDGLGGAAGPYTLAPFVTAPSAYQRWYECSTETPLDGLTPAEQRRRTYHFDSRTYCSNGCRFSLFAVVECGTEFHIPFYDVETGHMQIYDVLREQYVNLRATNLPPVNTNPPVPWDVSGTQVDWFDNVSSCTLGRGPGNNVVMDVSFDGTPNVCGVYRLDFIDWGGYNWYVYANCTRDRTEQYYLYRDLCSALDNYHPRPEIGFDPATVTVDNSNCGSREARGSFTIENVGCMPVANYSIRIKEAPPGTAEQVIQVTVLEGERQVVDWALTLSVLPGNLVFDVDPGNQTAECSENLGSVVSCGTNSPLVRTMTLAPCPSVCTTAPNAGPAITLCQGDPLVLDGSASTHNCVSGQPSYRWLEGSTVLCEGTTPGCAVPAPAPGSHIYTLETECAGDTPACLRQSQVLVEVIPNVEPSRVGNVLRAYRVNGDVVLAWTSILGEPVSVYRVYSSDDERVPAANRSRVAELPATSTVAVHPNGVIEPPFPINYYQAVGVSCRGDIEGRY